MNIRYKMERLHGARKKKTYIYIYSPLWVEHSRGELPAATYAYMKSLSHELSILAADSVYVRVYT